MAGYTRTSAFETKQRYEHAVANVSRPIAARSAARQAPISPSADAPIAARLQYEHAVANVSRPTAAGSAARQTQISPSADAPGAEQHEHAVASARSKAAVGSVARQAPGSSTTKRQPRGRS
jgi:hypothetical protein